MNITFREPYKVQRRKAIVKKLIEFVTLNIVFAVTLLLVDAISFEVGRRFNAILLIGAWAAMSAAFILLRSERGSAREQVWR
jgi:hypothetical protein